MYNITDLTFKGVSKIPVLEYFETKQAGRVVVTGLTKVNRTMIQLFKIWVGGKIE